MICYEGFWRNYPETFRDEEKMDADSESNEGETRPEKKAEIRERLLCKRTAERFMGYESLTLFHMGGGQILPFFRLSSL